MAISGALNGFALDLVRHVVEEECLGKLLYAGGDDVMAMTTTTDLLRTMGLLRAVYSGSWPDGIALIDEHKLKLHGGFVMRNKRLYQVMGKHATASTGAVIAHHQAPLAAVLRELRSAEQRAKNEGGRDAFCITIIKRSGGALYLTEKWGAPVNLLMAMRDFLATEGVSRRAVYHTLEWLNDSELPVNTFDSGMAQSLLAYQLDRQVQANVRKMEDWITFAEDSKVVLKEDDKKDRKGVVKAIAGHFADKLVKLALTWPQEKRIEKLRNFLSVAEFLARETRTESNTGGDA